MAASATRDRGGIGGPSTEEVAGEDDIEVEPLADLEGVVGGAGIVPVDEVAT